MINVLYDGHYPFLVSATRLLKRLDRRHAIHLTNVSARKFDARLVEKSQQELTGEIHAQLSDGTWQQGPDAVREICSAVGLAPLVMMTRIPVVRQLSNLGYRCLAVAMSSTVRSTRRTPPAKITRSTTLSSDSAFRASS